MVLLPFLHGRKGGWKILSLAGLSLHMRTSICYHIICPLSTTFFILCQALLSVPAGFFVVFYRRSGDKMYNSTRLRGLQAWICLFHVSKFGYSYTFFRKFITIYFLAYSLVFPPFSDTIYGIVCRFTPVNWLFLRQPATVLQAPQFSVYIRSTCFCISSPKDRAT